MFTHRYLADHPYVAPTMLGLAVGLTVALLAGGMPLAAGTVGAAAVGAATWLVGRLGRRRLVVDGEQVRWTTPNGTVAHRNLHELAAVRLGRSGRFYGAHLVDVTGAATGIASMPLLSGDRKAVVAAADLADRVGVPGPDRGADPADYLRCRLTL